MYKNSFVIFLVLVAACSSPKSNETVVPPVNAVDTLKPAPKNISYKDSLLGNWTDGSSENASIQIQPDSIYYIDHGDKYKYAIQNDSIKIFFPTDISASKMIFKGDTLLWISIQDTTKLWKYN